MFTYIALYNTEIGITELSLMLQLNFNVNLFHLGTCFLFISIYNNILFS